jgi:hypothetical protein
MSALYLTFITEPPPTAEQDAKNGYHRIVENGTKFCGFLLNGKKVKKIDILWFFVIFCV